MLHNATHKKSGHHRIEELAIIKVGNHIKKGLSLIFHLVLYHELLLKLSSDINNIYIFYRKKNVSDGTTNKSRHLPAT